MLAASCCAADSNQIVHPNFFSWAKVKTLFWKEQGDGAPADLIRILNANFRNSRKSPKSPTGCCTSNTPASAPWIARATTWCAAEDPSQGRVALLKDSDTVKRDLDHRTAESARFAILVLHPEQKAEVRRHFRTPLVFSIHEAKGLEYENVLLFGFVSSEEKRFRDIAGDLAEADLEGDLHYARGRDKGDKSLEVYKFYINALYVAVTRAVKNLYLIESRPQQALLELLGLTRVHEDVGEVEAQRSSLEEWRHEAHRLELQGKEEQAAEIRAQILKQREVPWTVLRGEALAALEKKALEAGEKKAGIALMEYALVYRDQRRLNALVEAGFKAAKQPDKAMPVLEKKHFMLYGLRNPGGVLREADKYGVDFRNVFGQTPLMIASRMGNAELARSYWNGTRTPAWSTETGSTPFRSRWIAPAPTNASPDPSSRRLRPAGAGQPRRAGGWAPGEAGPAPDGVSDALCRDGAVLPTTRRELGIAPEGAFGRRLCRGAGSLPRVRRPGAA